MTPDGITKTDWDRVHAAALQIANGALRSDPGAIRLGHKNLVYQLDRLEKRYGRLPSIVATRADYSSNQRQKVKWWKEGYRLAAAKKDTANLLLTAQSLCEFFVDEKQDVQQGSEWLSIMKGHLLSRDADGRRKCRQLERRLKHIH